MFGQNCFEQCKFGRFLTQFLDEFWTLLLEGKKSTRKVVEKGGNIRFTI